MRIAVLGGDVILRMGYGALYFREGTLGCHS